MRLEVPVSMAVLLFYGSLFGQSAPPGNQTQTFHVKGTITDPYEAVIQEVRVTFQNGQLSKTVTTDNLGAYEADLPLGDYTMTAQSRGFRFYRRPLFRVASPINVRFDIILPVGKNINRVVVGTATGPFSYCDEESFPAPSQDGVPFQLYIRYGGIRTQTGEARFAYSGDKTGSDDPVFVAYNRFSLRADAVSYDVIERTIKASGNVVAVNELSDTQRADSMTFKIEDGQVVVLR
jgi:hypothetical protein